MKKKRSDRVDREKLNNPSEPMLPSGPVAMSERPPEPEPIRSPEGAEVTSPTPDEGRRSQSERRAPRGAVVPSEGRRNPDTDPGRVTGTASNSEARADGDLESEPAKQASQREEPDAKPDEPKGRPPNHDRIERPGGHRDLEPATSSRTTTKPPPKPIEAPKLARRGNGTWYIDLPAPLGNLPPGLRREYVKSVLLLGAMAGDTSCARDWLRADEWETEREKGKAPSRMDLDLRLGVTVVDDVAPNSRIRPAKLRAPVPLPVVVGAAAMVAEQEDREEIKEVGDGGE